MNDQVGLFLVQGLGELTDTEGMQDMAEGRPCAHVLGAIVDPAVHPWDRLEALHVYEFRNLIEQRVCLGHEIEQSNLESSIRKALLDRE
ncbi:hypothetical protein D1872_295260 [compost metagenome]